MNLFGKSPPFPGDPRVKGSIAKGAIAVKQALDTQMAPGLKEITDTNQDRARVLKELRRRRQLSVLNRNTEEPSTLKRRLGGR